MDLAAYDIVKILHILSAVFLVGTIPFEFLLVWRAKAADRSYLASLLHHLEWVENRIAVPSALVLGASGLLMTLGPLAKWSLWNDGPTFAAVGLGLWLVLMVTFAGILTRRYKRLRAWAEGAATGDPGWTGWAAWSWFGLVLALLAVFVMIQKVP